jgi:hypothetical protein
MIRIKKIVRYFFSVGTCLTMILMFQGVFGQISLSIYYGKSFQKTSQSIRAQDKNKFWHQDTKFLPIYRVSWTHHRWRTSFSSFRKYDVLNFRANVNQTVGVSILGERTRAIGIEYSFVRRLNYCSIESGVGLTRYRLEGTPGVVLFYSTVGTDIHSITSSYRSHFSGQYIRPSFQLVLGRKMKKFRDFSIELVSGIYYSNRVIHTESFSYTLNGNVVFTDATGELVSSTFFVCLGLRYDLNIHINSNSNTNSKLAKKI